jgi:hypothetical protein
MNRLLPNTVTHCLFLLKFTQLILHFHLQAVSVPNFLQTTMPTKIGTTDLAAECMATTIRTKPVLKDDYVTAPK